MSQVLRQVEVTHIVDRQTVNRVSVSIDQLAKRPTISRERLSDENIIVQQGSPQLKGCLSQLRCKYPKQVTRKKKNG